MTCSAVLVFQFPLYIFSCDVSTSWERQPEWMFVFSLKTRAHLPSLIHSIQAFNKHFCFKDFPLLAGLL